MKTVYLLSEAEKLRIKITLELYIVFIAMNRFRLLCPHLLCLRQTDHY